MYRKILWCYTFILTLLDISPNIKLTAQGKSHGVTAQDSVIEGVTFQDWSSELGAEEQAEGPVGAGEAGVRLEPAVLAFGRAALGTAHARRVRLHNAANTTLHLASVAGSTPDFHASFFDAKTLPAGGNTSFTVVYLGRREGPVRAQLHVQTSRGVQRYRVHAHGERSAWRVWPLLSVRVPHNARLDPDLTIYNPTDDTVQVTEIYSSASWLGLQLPSGGDTSSLSTWRLPPHESRTLARLRLRPPRGAGAAGGAHTAYVRVRANGTAALVLAVEARAVPAGEHARPLHLPLGVRGHRDPPCSVDIELGNSLDAAVVVEASVWGARCASLPPASPAPPEPDDHAPPRANGAPDKHTANGGPHEGGGAGSGVALTLLRGELAPQQEPQRAAQLTIDHGRLWSEWESAGGGGGDAEEAWCAGWVRLGRAALPYSVRLLRGTLGFSPPHLDVVTGRGQRGAPHDPLELSVHNEFAVPVHLIRVDYPPEVAQHFQVEWWGGVVGPGARVAAARVSPRRAPYGPPSLAAALTLRTNLTDYTVPLRVYSTDLLIEWEWDSEWWGETWLSLGTLGTGGDLRVRARVINPAPARACLELGASLPRAAFRLLPCGELSAHHDSCRCVEGGGWRRAELAVRAGRDARAAAGVLWARAGRGGAAVRVSLRARPGVVRVLPPTTLAAAPYAWSSTELVLENSMSLQLRLVNVSQPPDAHQPDLVYVWGSGRGVGRGAGGLGAVRYEPERSCAPHCYTGLPLEGAEGAAWAARGAPDADAGVALRADAALLRARLALYHAAEPKHYTLTLHTDRVVEVPVRGRVRARWPRLCSGLGAAGAGAALAAVGGAASVPLTVRNPSRSHALLLQPLIHDLVPLPALAWSGAGAERAACARERCAEGGWSLREWRARRGGARAAPPPAPPGALLLDPDSELTLSLLFAPNDSLPFTSYLYLRNNLTILESVQLNGRGVYPSFEFGGQRPGTDVPLLFEVSECPGGAATVRRKVSVRNTGRVPLRLRDWRLCGGACAARGFSLEPCAPLVLAPNETRTLRLVFKPDFTLARVPCALRLRSDLGRLEFPLLATAPARLLPACAARASRPPFEPALRAAGLALALLAAAAALAAAALDAERLLRRARAARAPPLPARTLDLNRVAAPPAPPAPPPRAPPRRRKPPRRPPAAHLDPLAERRAFERWRAEVLRRDPLPKHEDDDRSSDDADRTPPATDTGSPCDPADDRDESGAEADAEDHPRTSGDEDLASTGTDSSTPPDERDLSEDRRDRDGSRAERAEPQQPVDVNENDEDTPPEFMSGELEIGEENRVPRPRRESGDTVRQADRPRSQDRPDATSTRPRPPGVKHHTRKDKSTKRRGERAPSTPARRSPATGSEPRGSTPSAGGNAAGGGGAQVRWGATWSSVVASGGSPVAEPTPAPRASPCAPAGPPAPIGPAPGARRGVGAEARAGDHSLFYFTGAEEFAWRAAPPPERATFVPHADYGPVTAPEERGTASNAYGNIRSLWTSAEEPPAAAWMWGGAGAGGGVGDVASVSGVSGVGSVGGVGSAYGAVRPPPGFSAPVRTFDPFQSLRLSSIWAPGALDWRREEPPAPPPAPADE